MTTTRTGRPRSIDPDALSLVALRLFESNGYERVSMDDIASAAAVSRRSLFRLFPSKASLVWGGLDEFNERFLAALARRPTTERGCDGVRAALRDAAMFRDDQLEVTRRRLRVINANSALELTRDSRLQLTYAAAADHLAERDRLPSASLEVTALAHALIAAGSAALTWWAHNDELAPGDAVDHALRTICHEPHAGSYEAS